MLSKEQITAALSPFQITPTSEQISMVREYLTLLLKWNRALSLTSIDDPVEIIARHFGESMFATTLLPVEKCRLADVGTGAGFPGLAMKILCPTMHLVLVESNKKKCVFLSEVVRALGFTDVEVLAARFEDIPSNQPSLDLRFDYVTARALGGHRELLRDAKKRLLPRGHIILWLGGEDVTLISANQEWIWQPATRIPESQRRFILIGRPRFLG